MGSDGGSGGGGELTGITVVLLLHLIACSMTIPALPSLLLEIFDDEPGRAAKYQGLLSGFQSLLEFCCMPALGAMSDSAGRKPVSDQR